MSVFQTESAGSSPVIPSIMKKCSTCLKKRVRWWELSKDCSVCRSGWRAFNRGDTPISPMQRAIVTEQEKRVKKARKKALKKRLKLINK
jgi:hypothetical protein